MCAYTHAHTNRDVCVCVWGRILSSTVGLQYHEVQAFLPHEPQTQSKHEPNSMPPKKNLKGKYNENQFQK